MKAVFVVTVVILALLLPVNQAVGYSLSDESDREVSSSLSRMEYVIRILSILGCLIILLGAPLKRQLSIDDDAAVTAYQKIILIAIIATFAGVIIGSYMYAIDIQLGGT